MRILLSNDDGIYAPGLKILYKELKKLGQVWVVAPVEEKSTTGHSLTIHKPLRITRLSDDFYSVNGSPADCVYLAVRQIIKAKPDLVISGINRGANLAQDVYYSGTVSAAREACILGIPALAVSVAIDFKNLNESQVNYRSAAKMALKLIKMMGEWKLPRHTFLNLNVPDMPFAKIKGIKTARQGFRFYGGNILRRKDHRGKDYYWIGGCYRGFAKEGQTDCSVIEESYASLTPIKLDSTDLQFMASLPEVLK